MSFTVREVWLWFYLVSCNDGASRCALWHESISTNKRFGVSRFQLIIDVVFIPVR